MLAKKSTKVMRGVALAIGIVVFTLIVFGRPLTLARASGPIALQSPDSSCSTEDLAWLQSVGIITEALSSLMCMNSNGLDYIRPVRGIDVVDITPYVRCPPPNPSGEVDPSGALYEPGQLLTVDVSGFRPGDFLDLAAYAPSTTPLILAKKYILELKANADGRATGTIRLDPDTIPGSYSFIACSESTCAPWSDITVRSSNDQTDDSLSGFSVTAQNGLNLRVQPSAAPYSTVRLLLPKGSLVQPLEYPRRTVDGSLWYPVIPPSRPDSIGWVSSKWLQSANTPTTFAQDSLRTALNEYLVSKGCPKPTPTPTPSPGSGCDETAPDGAISPCMEIEVQD